ncbi:MAG: protein kinase [Rubrivivax sp.]|nr:protein kinase [Rubrivivax sp.]
MTLAVADLQRLSSLLDEALDLTASERTGWLAALPEEARPLATTLRDLLSRHAQADTVDFASAPLRLLAEATDRGGDAVNGTQVGPYRLIRELGTGGMGAVWLAERTDGLLDRKVALKLPHAGWTRGLAQRFARERVILSGLEHPHIARLYDAGEDSLGRPYMALEYVEGETIDVYCRAHALDVPARLGLLLQVADAVAFAHSRLVLHRDLKPSNILVTGTGQVRLLDFGIAKLIEGDRAAETELTRAGGRALTVGYASPEQIRGRPLSTASDVYSLGVVAYEVLASVHPYPVDRSAAVPPEQQVLAAQPRPASAAAAEPALRRALRGDLDVILAHALDKDPAARYPTVEAFASDLRAHLQGLPVRARGETLAYRLSRLLARRWQPAAAALAIAVLFGIGVGVGATALLALVLGGGLALALWQARNLARERDRALRLSESHEAVASFLNTLITDAGRGGQVLTAEQLLKRSEWLVGHELEDVHVHAMVLGMIGSSMQTLGNSAEAVRLTEKAVALIRGHDDPDLRDRVVLTHSLAIGWAGRYAEARAALQAIVARRGAALTRRTEAHHYLAILAGANNDPDAALLHAEQALSCLRAQKNGSRKFEASLLGSLGQACSLHGRMAEAERHYAAAFARMQALGHGATAHAVTLLNNWAVICERAGDARQSLELVERALDLAGSDGRSPFLLVNRARAFENLGRIDDAVPVWHEALALAAELQAVPATIAAQLGLASMAVHQGKTGEGQARLQMALDAGLSATPPRHPQRISSHLIEGRVALADGKVGTAQTAFESALDAAPVQATAVMARLGLAEVAHAQGKPECMAQLARAAKAQALELQGGKPQSFRTALASATLARALHALGDAKAAQQEATEAVERLTASVDALHPAFAEARVLAAR